MRKTFTLATLALAASPLAFAHGVSKIAQSAQQEVIITSEDLGSGVHMLIGQGGNIGLLIGRDGVFVIDSQFAPIAPKNLAKINELSGSTPKYLVNTHWHGDHTGGNGNFGAAIIAHENTRKRLTTQMVLNRLGTESVSEPTDPALWPVITFDDKLKLHLNGQTISVFHTPDAHTDTDAMVHFEEANVLHMGDVYFKGSFPFVDVGSGGTIAGYIAAMETAYARTNKETKIIPGHGALATRADLAESIAMLKGVEAAVAKAIAEGLTSEDAIKADILAAYKETWGKGFINAERMISFAYQDMTRLVAAKAAHGPEDHEGHGS